MQSAQNAGKIAAATAALAYVDEHAVLGVGTGSTVNFFIEALAQRQRARPLQAVSSSAATTALLRRCGIEVLDLNDVPALHLYVDGADETNCDRQLIKGGGGALTREKIVAAVAERFVCIVDASKVVAALGAFPLPIEVIPMARAYVQRRLRHFGGEAVPRAGYVTDNGNEILDVRGLRIDDPPALERELNQIPGIVTVGLFALRPADIVLVGHADGRVDRF